jgi:hypothetical protein
MLHVSSARGILTWRAWRDAYDSVAANSGEGDLLPSNRAADQLDSLGHIEIASLNGELKVAAAPAVLALLPRLGLPTAVLCGGRSPHTESRLRKAAEANSARLIIFNSSQERQKAPRAFFLEAEDVEHLAAAASAAAVHFASIQPAWSLVNSAGSVESYLAGLSWRHEPEPNLNCSELDVDLLRFGFRRPNAQGMRLLRYFPRVLPSYHEVRGGEKAARVERSWGVYATLKAHGKNCIVHDSHAKAVAAPASAPLPRLLARALTLCSGLAAAWLPASSVKWPFKESDGFQVYTSVPDSIAKMLFSKVGQTALPLHIPAEFLQTLNYHRPYE